jgi:hypothetical protein
MKLERLVVYFIEWYIDINIRGRNAIICGEINVELLR